MAAILTFIVSIISDKVGWKLILNLIWIFGVFGSLLGYFGNDAFTISTGVLLIWTAGDIIFSVGVIYINEIASNYLRSKSPLFFLFNSIGGIIINFVLYKFTNYRDYYLIILFGILLTIYPLLRLIESPFHYFS